MKRITDLADCRLQILNGFDNSQIPSGLATVSPEQLPKSTSKTRNQNFIWLQNLPKDTKRRKHIVKSIAELEEIIVEHLKVLTE